MQNPIIEMQQRFAEYLHPFRRARRYTIRMHGMHSLIDRFIDSLLVEEGASRNTTDAYSRDLVRFIEAMRVEKPEEITNDVVQEYREKLSNEKGLGDNPKMRPATIARKLSAIKRFLRWLEAEHHIDEWPLPREFKLPKSFPLPESLPYSEVKTLIESPKDDSPQGIRDRALLEFLYATGIRVSELCGMPITDLIFQKNSARVHGKGEKSRAVPFGSRTSARVRAYLEKSRPTFPNADSLPDLWLGRKGPLSRTQVYRLVKKYTLKAGITRPVSPHTLRHSCAMHMLEGGADLRVVQEILGHSSIQTIVHYTRYNIEEQRRIYDACHPHGGSWNGTEKSM